MNKHTPGPWLCCHRPESPTIHYIQEDDGSNCINPIEIATVFESGRDPEQQRANARLITAAPDLLGAAILARATLGITEIFLGKDGMQLMFGSDIESYKATQDLLEDAIAKAEGKS